MKRMLSAALALAAAGCAAGPAADAGPDRSAGDPWAASAQAGYAFRGVGQEPGWTVEVAPGREIRLVLDYVARTVLAPAVTPLREGRRVTHRGRTADGDVRVEVEEAPCSDAMSGERMTHRVTAWIPGDRRLQGCGFALPRNREGRVDGWWRLEELGGRPPVGAAGDATPSLRIERADGRASGSTGCNSFGGSVSVEGDRIDFGALATTRRACMGEGVMEQERRFTEALEAADRYAVVEGMLVLMRGEAVLARFSPWDGPPPGE